MSAAFAGAGPSGSTTIPTPTSVPTSTTEPNDVHAASTTIGPTSTPTYTTSTTTASSTTSINVATSVAGHPFVAPFAPTTSGSPTTTTPVTLVHSTPLTVTTVLHYPFVAPFDETDPGSPTAPREPSSQADPVGQGPTRVVHRQLPGDGAGGATTTTEPARPASRSQDSAALASASRPVATNSGVSLFWPVVLGLCCLALLGGPIAARRLSHPD